MARDRGIDEQRSGAALERDVAGRIRHDGAPAADGDARDRPGR
jgi:hypothetical protein